MSEVALILERMKKAEGKDAVRGLRRSVTCYCQKQARKTGQPFSRFLAAIKMRATKKGLDTSMLG